MLLCRNPWKRLSSVIERLERWHDVRPLQYFSRCPYARSLLREGIVLCKVIIEINNDPEAHEWLRLLQLMLDIDPPPKSPPVIKGRLSGGLCFLHARVGV